MKQFFPALLTVAVVLTSCGGQRTAPRTEPNSQPGQEADEADYRIEIRNQDFYGVNAYVFRDGYRNRLGTVEGKTSRTFTFNWVLPNVRILLDFVGGGCIRTESMEVVFGDDLLLIVLAGDHRKASRSLC